MEALHDMVLAAPHADGIRALLDGSDEERAAYMLFGTSEIGADPWTGKKRLRLVSHRFIGIVDSDVVSRSSMHVTWSTESFMCLLGEAERSGLVPAIVHTHPGGFPSFSDQDDRNESELARTVRNKGLPGLVSIVIGASDEVGARLWTSRDHVIPMVRIIETGRRLRIWPRTRDSERALPIHLDRQARLFGDRFNDLLDALRIGIVGCGGTGSAVATLLARLGVGKLLLIDRDQIETTNLNRVHGARRADVVSKRLKAPMLRGTIVDADLGVDVVAVADWVGNPACDDALKSCDIIFGCTDDHAGRAFLNRLAYFYGIPLIDVGLSMRAATEGSRPDITGRVSTHLAGHTCMMCSGLVDPRLAAEQSLARNDPAEYARRKAEAYVVGSGDPAPAVVTFTTEAASMAVNELINALTGYRDADGMAPMSIRKFHDMKDLSLRPPPKDECPSCNGERWGRGDVEPFLEMIR